jgi:hypothetical protein
MCPSINTAVTGIDRPQPSTTRFFLELCRNPYCSLNSGRPLLRHAPVGLRIVAGFLCSFWIADELEGHALTRMVWEAPTLTGDSAFFCSSGLAAELEGPAST